MARVKGKVRRATKRGIDKIETRILVHEGKKSVRAKVATVKRVAKKALKAGLISGAIAAVTVVLQERRKRRQLTD